VLDLARIVLVARYPSTHALFDDWYNHAMYFFLFLFGAMMARQREFWQRLDAMRWAALGIALACCIEGILLLVLTVTFSFAIFELVRRCVPLRPLRRRSRRA
jgi:hypothetical protein